MKKILFLLLLFTTSIFAAETYELLVNTPQEVGMYTALLESIHYFFHGETGSNYFSLLRTIVLFGTIMTMIKVAGNIAQSESGAKPQSVMAIASYQVFIVFMLLTLFGREANIVIRHPESLTFNVSPLIPDVFAYTISFFSGLNYKMTLIAESSFSTLRNQGIKTAYTAESYSENPSYGMTGLGYAGLPTILSRLALDAKKSLKIESSGRTMQEISRPYLKDCVILPIMANNPQVIGEVLHSNNFYSTVDPTVLSGAYNVETANLLMKYGTTGYITCQEGYDMMTDFINLLKSDFPKDRNLENAAIYYLNQLQQGDFSGGTFSTSAGTTTLAAAAAAAKETQINAQLNLDAFNVYKDLGSQGVIAASGEAAALTDLQQNGSTMGMFMARYLPVFSSFIFMIMIAAFPFMFAFALMPGGWSIMVQFVKTLAWISLWSPMAAILNFFIDYRMVERITESGVNGFISSNPDMTKLVDISSEAALMAGLAGYLYMMVPALSWMLVTGSGVMLSNITGALGGAFQKHGNADAAAEAAATKGAAEMADTSVAEMSYYQTGAKMAASSAEFQGQKNVYGGNFGLMSDDMAKQNTSNMAAQRGAGSMMTMEGAKAGGMASGKISGAQTMAMGEAYAGVSDSQYMGAASFEARQSAAATQATSVANGKVSNAEIHNAAMDQAAQRVGGIKSAANDLGIRGGFDGVSNDMVIEGEKASEFDHEQANMLRKHKEKHGGFKDAAKGAAKKDAESMGSMASLGSKGMSVEEYDKKGGLQQDIQNNADKAMLYGDDKKGKDHVKGLNDYSNSDKQKIGQVQAGQQLSGMNAIVNAVDEHNKPISAHQQMVNQQLDATRGIQDSQATYGGNFKQGNKLLNSSRTEAEHSAEMLNQKAELTRKAKSLKTLVAKELQGYAATVGDANKQVDASKNLKKSQQHNEKIKKLSKEIQEMEDELGGSLEEYKSKLKKDFLKKESKILKMKNGSEKTAALQAAAAEYTQKLHNAKSDYRAGMDAIVQKSKQLQDVMQSAAKPVGATVTSANIKQLDKEISQLKQNIAKYDKSGADKNAWIRKNMDYRLNQLQSQRLNAVNADINNGTQSIQTQQWKHQTVVSNFENRVAVLGAGQFSSSSKAMGDGNLVQSRGVVNSAENMRVFGMQQTAAIQAGQAQYRKAGIDPVRGAEVQAQRQAGDNIGFMNAANNSADAIFNAITTLDPKARGAIIANGGGNGNNVDTMIAMQGLKHNKMSTVAHGGDVMYTTTFDGKVSSSAYDHRRIWNDQTVIRKDALSGMYFDSNIAGKSYNDANFNAGVYDYGTKALQATAGTFVPIIRRRVGNTFSSSGLSSNISNEVFEQAITRPGTVRGRW